MSQDPFKGSVNENWDIFKNNLVFYKVKHSCILCINQGKSGCQRVRFRGQRIANLSSETQEHYSQISNNSTEELSFRLTKQDGCQEDTGVEDPVQSYSSLKVALKQSSRSVQMTTNKTLILQPENQGSGGLRHQTVHLRNNWMRI